MQKHKQLKIRNDINELNRVVAFLDNLEEEWKFPANLKTSFNLVLEEALTNIIFYAYEKNTENEIILEFEMEENQLKIILKDNGKPYDPTQQEDPDINLSAEDRPIGGLGIFLIKQMMNQVSYQRRENTNQLTLVKKWEPTNT
jgi:serine/threonine-protein kinase RsbW